MTHPILVSFLHVTSELLLQIRKPNTAIDIFVDELIIENSNLGTAVLIADFPRLY